MDRLSAFMNGERNLHQIKLGDKTILKTPNTVSMVNVSLLETDRVKRFST